MRKSELKNKAVNMRAEEESNSKIIISKEFTSEKLNFDGAHHFTMKGISVSINNKVLPELKEKKTMQKYRVKIEITEVE